MADPVYQFVNSAYFHAKYEDGTFNKVREDALIIAYKCNGEQKVQIIETPNFSFRVAKPHLKLSHPEDYVKIEDTDEVTVKYSDLNKVIAEITGKGQQYMNLKRDRNVEYKVKNDFARRLHLDPRLFSSDFNIEDQYKINFVTKYGINIGKYKKAVFDIEVDGLDSGGEIDPLNAPDPVNCLSLYDFTTDAMYVLIWDQPERYPTFGEFRRQLDSGEFERRLRSDPEMNGEFEKSIESKRDPRVNTNTAYKFEFFREEVDLIIRFYDLIHALTPDFVLAWNHTYDNLTLHGRLRRFHEEGKCARIEDIVCDPIIPPKYREVRYKEDNSAADYYNKWHWFTIPGRTVYLCSMATYAYIRKSAGVQPSYGLNDICQKELGKGKYSYSDIADDVLQLPYANFSEFVFYNIKDTWLLADLETKQNDIDQIMYAADCTRLEKCTKLTTAIRNTQYMFYQKKGLIMGNNINAIIENPKVEYDGAIVADPMLNTKIVSPLFRFPSKMIRPYVADNDLISMYPMMAISHNIYKTTLIAQITSIGLKSIMGGTDGVDAFDITECIDNFETNRPTRWGNQYLQLPSMEHMIGVVNETIGVVMK